MHLLILSCYLNTRASPSSNASALGTRCGLTRPLEPVCLLPPWLASGPRFEFRVYSIPTPAPAAARRLAQRAILEHAALARQLHRAALARAPCVCVQDISCLSFKLCASCTSTGNGVGACLLRARAARLLAGLWCCGRARCPFKQPVLRAEIAHSNVEEPMLQVPEMRD